MGPSRRDRCVSWIAGIRFETQDRAVCKSVEATLRSGEGNVETREHDAGHISCLFEDEGVWSNIWH